MQKMRTPEEVCNRIAMLHESLADVHRQQCPTGEAWQATIASLERLGLQHELVGQVKALLWALEKNGMPSKPRSMALGINCQHSQHC